MSMNNNNRANCWLFYFIRKRCNQAPINQWLKWTRALQLSLSGHLTSVPLLYKAAPQSLQPGSIWEGASHVSGMKRAMNLPLMDRCHMLCPQMWRGRGGGFHTDRINMWKWLTSLYVSDVLRVLYISWEAFSKDVIHLQNMVNFPSVGYPWLRASFVHCLACPSVASVSLCICACMQTYVCVCITPV